MSEDEKPVTRPFTVNDRRHFAVDGSTVETTPSEQERDEEEPSEPAEAADRAREVDLAGFVMSLGLQAGALLEAIRKGEESPGEALPAVRSIVSVLEMLQVKTEGNRTDEETRVLDSLLYELHLGYVEAARVAGS
jgi:Domain of unknown function (DUF1844)